ncbi:GFA family protein [Pseudooctadecabacter jejudonensis]|uniref:Glutathione-dependent formaldehyde-activating enzyme n=1 Tax=Pseudooctadecabacter jejudonensis TaxID=1391910 RepID=A0A1Y5RVN3_9RHOB|nr:GFA family protein [Pseudooctadecabacter jejudonensis]SLN23604.1 Glutathione-dependent formaldehyde-activating enzyme [Pseudooctadecabacter jejudonensis]
MTRVSCHCGAVELRVTLSEPLSNARRCDCSFCARRGAAVLFVAIGDLEIVQGQDALTCYQWNTMQEEHFFCKHCGLYTHHRHADPTAGYAVNFGAIEGVNPREYGQLPWLDGRSYQPADYSGDTR